MNVKNTETSCRKAPTWDLIPENSLLLGNNATNSVTLHPMVKYLYSKKLQKKQKYIYKVKTMLKKGFKQKKIKTD